MISLSPGLRKPIDVVQDPRLDRSQNSVPNSQFHLHGTKDSVPYFPTFLLDMTVTGLSNFTWRFDPVLNGFPHAVVPNVAIWNATNGVDLHYQIQVTWPLEWESRGVDRAALTMYQHP